jgi:uncharacterized protein YgiB involved in biofilm formation
MSDMPPRRFSPRRRSRLALGGIAAAGLGFGLSGCEDVPAEPMRFSSVEQCVSAGLEQPFCESTYSAALAQHRSTAPQYSGRDECEDEWGEYGCESAPVASGGQSVFTPLLAGFLVGQALNRRDAVYYGGGGYYGSPIYRNRGGQAVTLAPGNTNARAVRTTPVNVGTTTVARSGFGGMGMSRGGGGWGG